MPIQLPPLSRRQFLGRSIAATAALAFHRRLLADELPVDPHSWALLSDPHIAADREKVSRNVNMTKNLTGVVREVLQWPRRPAGVMVNGDCAFATGESGDYATFMNLLEPIREARLPIHLTLGNHDNRNHLWDAIHESADAKRPVADRHVGVIRGERANWFLLDTLEKTNSTPGLMGDAQLDWLAKTLGANSDKPAIILSHHNLEKGDAKMGLKDTEKLLALIEPLKHVKAYIFGHTHNWEIQKHPSGIHLVNLPPVGYAFKEGKPSGWVSANVQSEGLRLELRCVDTKHADHGQVVELAWRQG